MEEERPTRNIRVRVGQGLELEASRWKILLIVQVRYEYVVGTEML
jgi:hypothetical protein